MTRLIGLAVALIPAAAVLIWQRQADASVLQDLPVDSAAPATLPATLPDQSFLEATGIMSGNQTRGERNNNPGNIRLSNAAWQGKVAGSDTAFETFADPESGLRALAKLLQNYQRNYALNTIRGIISRWAPSTENNTNAYVSAVAAEVGINPDAAVDLQNPDTLQRLVAAIVHHENGRVVYASSQIAAAVGAA